MKKVLDRIIKFITSKRVKKFFAREFLILLFGITTWAGTSLYVNSFEPSRNSNWWKDFVAFEFWIYILLLLYGTRILYLFFRFVGWCFRIVFLENNDSNFSEDKVSRYNSIISIIGKTTVLILLLTFIGSVYNEYRSDTKIEKVKLGELYERYVNAGLLTPERVSFDDFSNSSPEQQVFLFKLAREQFFSFYYTTFSEFTSAFLKKSPEDVRLENIWTLLTSEDLIRSLSFDEWLLKLQKDDSTQTCTFCNKENVYSYLSVNKFTVSTYDTWLENVGLR